MMKFNVATMAILAVAFASGDALLTNPMQRTKANGYVFIYLFNEY